MKFYISIVCLCFISLSFMKAQVDLVEPKPTYEYGFMGFSNLGIFTTDIKGAKGFESCCNGFSTGFGLGLTLGVTYKYYFNDFIAFNSKLGYLNQNTTFFYSEFLPVSIVKNSQIQYLEAEIEHSLQLDVNRIIFSPGLSLKIGKVANLNFNYLMNVEVATNFKQEERLIDPVQGTFDGVSRIRNSHIGSFKSNQLMHYIAIGINKSIPLNSKNTLILSPELNLIIGVNNQVDYGKLKNNFFSFGFILAFRNLDLISNTPLGPR